MSNLASYLKERGIRQAEFAERIGANQATVSKLSNGTMSPSLDLAAVIERETGGAVPMQSWVNTEPQRAAS